MEQYTAAKSEITPYMSTLLIQQALSPLDSHIKIIFSLFFLFPFQQALSLINSQIEYILSFFYSF